MWPKEPQAEIAVWPRVSPQPAFACTPSLTVHACSGLVSDTWEWSSGVSPCSQAEKELFCSPDQYFHGPVSAQLLYCFWQWTLDIQWIVLSSHLSWARFDWVNWPGRAFNCIRASGATCTAATLNSDRPSLDLYVHTWTFFGPLSLIQSWKKVGT